MIQSADGFVPRQLMRIAYLDCFSGISGDMFLGALIDAGVPARLLEDPVAALNIGASLQISKVTRSGISATKVDVLASDALAEAVTHEHSHHTHDHEHGHSHSHSHDEKHGHSHEHTRGLKEIREI